MRLFLKGRGVKEGAAREEKTAHTCARQGRGAVALVLHLP